MNKVILTGRLGKNPELIELQSGTKKATMSLATNGFKDKDGNEKTDWHRLVAFNKTAETMAAHLRTGRLIGVEGRLQTRSWEAENGKRSITEVIVDRFEFLSPKNGNGSNGSNGNGHGHAQAADAAVASDASESVGYEDLTDVPF